MRLEKQREKNQYVDIAVDDRWIGSCENKLLMVVKGIQLCPSMSQCSKQGSRLEGAHSSSTEIPEQRIGMKIIFQALPYTSEELTWPRLSQKY